MKDSIVVIGGGIVGLATALKLLVRFPKAKITILEKESTLASHQTGHNSGVLHSGIYYKPGSLKLHTCRQGLLAMRSFCDKYDLPYETCGKVIVATHQAELPRLQALYERGQKNQIDCTLIDKQRLRELEPYCDGIQALHVPDAGIIDYRAVSMKLVSLLEKRGVQIITEVKVIGVERLTDSVCIKTARKQNFYAERVVSCAGLYSDVVARLAGAKPEMQIVPFRGEYYFLREEAEYLCQNLIYPVPDPAFPFLGVHFTRTIDNRRECGPNAVLALAREGYRWRDIDLGELIKTFTYPGFIRFALRHMPMGLGEMWRSVNKNAFVKALQRLVPDIRADHLVHAPAGVRAQALSPTGQLVDDFHFVADQGGKILHVCNAPSPAATASLAIGEAIAHRLV